MAKGNKAALQSPSVEPPREQWAAPETKLKRLSKKDYATTISRWSSTILTIPTPGTPPQEAVGSLIELAPALKNVPRSAERREFIEIRGVRAGVLHESIYFLHKAWHVAALCTRHIEAGRLTWAEVDAYQSALFSMSAVLGLFGITFPTQNTVLDVWPSPSKVEKKAKTHVVPADVNEIQIIAFQSLDHYVKWSILKRILRTCSPDSLAHTTGLAIADIGDTTFAERRNKVHYQAGKWLHKDLFEPLNSQTFGRSASEEILFDSLRQQDEHFSISLMLAMLNLSHRMASNIGALSGTIAAELALTKPYIDDVKRLWAGCGS